MDIGFVSIKKKKRKKKTQVRPGAKSRIDPFIVYKCSKSREDARAAWGEKLLLVKSKEHRLPWIFQNIQFRCPFRVAK